MPLVRVGPPPIAGQCLFATADIPKDTCIIEYTGEKISTRESLRRLAQGNVYIFRLNYRFAIDGQALENLARYINHSCDPNCASDKIEGHLLSLFRLNHWLPWSQAHSEIMQGTTDFHYHIAEPLLPQTEAIFHNATAFDTTIDVFDPPPAVVQGVVGQLLLQRELLAPKGSWSA